MTNQQKKTHTKKWKKEDNSTKRSAKEDVNLSDDAWFPLTCFHRSIKEEIKQFVYNYIISH